MHLQSGNAVGNNPRTQSKFKKGDKVYRGEIIGYTGITGNAYNVKNPHLHISVFDYSKGGFVNPEVFINGETQKSEDGKIASKNIVKIICDDEILYE